MAPDGREDLDDLAAGPDPRVRDRTARRRRNRRASGGSSSTWPDPASNDARGSRRSGCAAPHPAGSCWTARPGRLVAERPAGDAGSARRRVARLVRRRRWPPPISGVGEGARTRRRALGAGPTARVTARPRSRTCPTVRLRLGGWTPPCGRPGSCSSRRHGAGTRTATRPTSRSPSSSRRARRSTRPTRRCGSPAARVPRGPAGAGLPRRPGRAINPPLEDVALAGFAARLLARSVAGPTRRTRLQARSRPPPTRPGCRSRPPTVGAPVGRRLGLPQRVAGRPDAADARI